MCFIYVKLSKTETAIRILQLKKIINKIDFFSRFPGKQIERINRRVRRPVACGQRDTRARCNSPVTFIDQTELHLDDSIHFSDNFDDS